MFPGFIRNMEMRGQEASGNELGLRSLPDSAYKVDGAIAFLLLTEQRMETFFFLKGRVKNLGYGFLDVYLSVVTTTKSTVMQLPFSFLNVEQQYKMCIS